MCVCTYTNMHAHTRTHACMHTHAALYLQLSCIVPIYLICLYLTLLGVSLPQMGLIFRCLIVNMKIVSFVEKQMSFRICICIIPRSVFVSITKTSHVNHESELIEKIRKHSINSERFIMSVFVLSNTRR